MLSYDEKDQGSEIPMGGLGIGIESESNRNHDSDFFWSILIGRYMARQQMYTVILWCTIEHNGAFTAPQLIV